jgi:hypothetical protein
MCWEEGPTNSQFVLQIIDFTARTGDLAIIKWYVVNFTSTIICDRLIYDRTGKSSTHQGYFLFHFRGCHRLGSSLFFNGPMYFNCGIMVWTLKSFCGLGHSAQPRLRRTWVTLLGHRSNSQHQDHHNLGRLHPWTFTGGKSHLQSVSTISGQTIFVDPLFLGWWLFSFVGLVPNAANYTQGPPTAWCPWCCQLQTACQQIPILMDQPVFCS